MKFLSLIICFLCALSLWADAVIVIKGKERRSSIKIEDRAGLTARVRRYNTTTEVGLRPRKKFQSAKLTGPKVEKGGQKSQTLSRPKAVKGSVKLKKGAKLIIEVTLRSTPKKEAKKRSAEGTMSKRQKERLKREEAKDKARKAEAEREEKARKAADEANRKIIEKRFGIKQNKKEESGKKSAKDAAPSSGKKAPEAPAEEAPEEGGNQ